ncbi:MAG: diguanylate cyclase, partial [Pseudomonadota bacterium]
MSISVALQYAAAMLALRLTRTVGGRVAWLTLALALFLMAVRRSISLYSAVAHYPDRLPLLDTELVALLISVLMVLAVVSIRPIFEAIRSSEQALAEQTRRNQVILDSSPDGFCITDLEGNLREVNKAYCEMLGHTPEELLSMNVYDLDVGSDTEQMQQNYRAVLAHGQSWFETHHRHSDGHAIEMDVTAKYVEMGNERFIYTFYRDISARKQAEAAFLGEKERALVTLESIGDGVITTDVAGRIHYMNPVAEHLTGLDEQAVSGVELSEVVSLEDETSGEPVDAPVLQCLSEQRSIRLSGQTLLLSAREAESHSVEVSVSPIHDDRRDTVVGTVLVLHDITELRGLARQLTYQATHDALTGLINRREFEVRLESALELALRAEATHAVCYLDLDQFKVVNDTCGHTAGDELLRQIAHELQRSVRDSDTLARLGGDEFGVLLQGCSLAQAEQVAEKLRDAVQRFRFVWVQNVFDVGVSIGLVPIDANSGTLTDILSEADSACYVAKEHGRNRVHRFQPDDTALAQHHGHRRWMQRIQRALEDDRFVLYYQ